MRLHALLQSILFLVANYFLRVFNVWLEIACFTRVLRVLFQRAFYVCFSVSTLVWRMAYGVVSAERRAHASEQEPAPTRFES